MRGSSLVLVLGFVEPFDDVLSARAESPLEDLPPRASSSQDRSVCANCPAADLNTGRYRGGAGGALWRFLRGARGRSRPFWPRPRQRNGTSTRRRVLQSDSKLSGGRPEESHHGIAGRGLRDSGS